MLVRLTGSLCAAITGERESGSMLETGLSLAFLLCFLATQLHSFSQHIRETRFYLSLAQSTFITFFHKIDFVYQHYQKTLTRPPVVIYPLRKGISVQNALHDICSDP